MELLLSIVTLYMVCYIIQDDILREKRIKDNKKAMDRIMTNAIDNCELASSILQADKQNK